nr:uncharacterized protein LOC119168035 [Rhipicephalus microplus]
MTPSTTGKILLCAFSVIMFIDGTEGRCHGYAPKWKPPKDKAFPICGVDLVEGATCKLPAWCPGNQGTCCQNECICPGRYNPCLLPHSTSPMPCPNTAATTTPCPTCPTTASTTTASTTTPRYHPTKRHRL